MKTSKQVQHDLPSSYPAPDNRVLVRVSYDDFSLDSLEEDFPSTPGLRLRRKSGKGAKPCQG